MALARLKEAPVRTRKLVPDTVCTEYGISGCFDKGFKENVESWQLCAAECAQTLGCRYAMIVALHGPFVQILY